MTIVGIKVKRRKSELKDLKDPKVAQQVRDDAERAVRDEVVRRRLRKLRAIAHFN